MKKLLSFSIYYFIFCLTAVAQPVQWFNLQTINPAFAGFTVGHQLGAQHRIGWPGIEFDDQAAKLSYQMPLYKINSGIGAQLAYEKVGGIFFSGSWKLQYAYQKSFSDNVNIRFGAEFGLLRRTFENGNMTFGNQFSTGFGLRNPQRSNFSDLVDVSVKEVNIGAGTVINANNFMAGIAVRHNKIAALQTNRLQLAANAGYFIMLSDDVEKGWVLYPNAVFVKSRSWADAHVGIQASRDIYTFGTSVNSLGDLSINWNMLFGVNVNRLRLGYSFNVPIAAYSFNLYPSHEFFLGFRIGKYDTVQAPKQAKLLNRFF